MHWETPLKEKLWWLKQISIHSRNIQFSTIPEIIRQHLPDFVKY
jgi:hypothetical protein